MILIENINTGLSLLSNGCILAITLYTFYLKFICKKIRYIQYAPSYSRFGGDSLSVVIENVTLSPICFDEVNIIYGNKYKLLMRRYDEPQSIEPFKNFVVKMEPFSCLEGISFSELDNIKDTYLEINTSKGMVYTRFNKNIKIYKRKKNKVQLVSIVRTTYNGCLIFPETKYALIYLKNGECKTIFIDNKGYMSQDVNGFNAIPLDILNDKKKMEEVLGKEFSPLGIQFMIENIEFGKL